MTPEQRLDRLERIAKLMVKAGLRARRQSREQDEKINILIDRQMKTGEAIAALAEAQARSEERLAGSEKRGAHTDARLDRLVETVDRYISERRSGNP